MERALTKDTTENDDIGHILIDSPVGPYSPIDEIRDWIEELNNMPDTLEVRKALEEAKSMFEMSKKHHSRDSED